MCIRDRISTRGRSCDERNVEHRRVTLASECTIEMLEAMQIRFCFAIHGTLFSTISCKHRPPCFPYYRLTRQIKFLLKKFRLDGLFSLRMAGNRRIETPYPDNVRTSPRKPSLLLDGSSGLEPSSLSLGTAVLAAHAHSPSANRLARSACSAFPSIAWSTGPSSCSQARRDGALYLRAAADRWFETTRADMARASCRRPCLRLVGASGLEPPTPTVSR